MTPPIRLAHPRILQEALTLGLSHTEDSDFPASNLIFGPKGNFFRLAAAATGTLGLDFDLGSGNEKAIDHLILARADLFVNSDAVGISVKGSNQSRKTPEEVSSANLQVWYDASLGHTIGSNERISQLDDQSGNDDHLTQATEASKPRRSRGDNRENLAIRSQELDNAAWTKNGCSVSADQIANPVDSLVNADLVTEDTSTGNHFVDNDGASVDDQGKFDHVVTIRVGCYAKTNGRNIRVQGQGNLPGSSYADFDLSAGTVSGTGAGADSAEITSLGDGWYRCEVVISKNSTTTAAEMEVYLLNGTSVSYTGDGSSGAYIWGCETKENSRHDQYIATTDDPLYGGVNGINKIKFDADSMNVAFSGTVAQPLSVWVVLRAAEDNDTICDGDSTDCLIETTGTGSVQVDAGTALDSGFDIVGTGSFHIIEVVYNSTSTKIYVDNDLKVTGDAGTNGLDGVTLGDQRTGSDRMNMSFCEYMVFDAELSSAERTKVYEYLRDKWITPAIHTNLELDLETLKGPQSQDYIRTFPETKKYRHFWIELTHGRTATKYLCSKVQVGEFFQFGDRGPNDQFVPPQSSNTPPKVSQADAKQQFRTRMGRIPLEAHYEFGLHDTERNTWQSDIGDFYDINPVWLYAPDNKDLLGNQELLFMWIVSWDINSQLAVDGWNKLALDFKENISF